MSTIRSLLGDWGYRAWGGRGGGCRVWAFMEGCLGLEVIGWVRGLSQCSCSFCLWGFL